MTNKTFPLKSRKNTLSYSRTSESFFFQFFYFYPLQNTRTRDRKDSLAELSRGCSFLRVYLSTLHLLRVLSSSLSTEHHKAGAGERGVLGDRDKRGWQLKANKLKQRCSKCIALSCTFTFSFSRATGDPRPHLRRRLPFNGLQFNARFGSSLAFCRE